MRPRNRPETIDGAPRKQVEHGSLKPAWTRQRPIAKTWTTDRLFGEELIAVTDRAMDEGGAAMWVARLGMAEANG